MSLYQSFFNGIIPKNAYIYFLCLFASLGGFLLGYDVGVISCVKLLPTFIEQFDLDRYSLPFAQGLVVSILVLGCFLGSLLSGVICDLLGRKKAIFVGSVLCSFGAVMQTFSSDIFVLCVGRFVSGLGIGKLSMAVPLYQSEIAPKELRGRLVSFLQLSIVLGILLSFWIVYGLRNLKGNIQWQLPILSQLVPSLILGAGILLSPDSPRWLIAKERTEEAKLSLTRLRSFPLSNEKINDEYEEIKQSIITSNQREIKSYSQLVKKPIRKSFFLGVCVQMFQQLTGINLIMYYAPSIFSKLGSSTETSLLMQAISGVVNIVFTIPAVLLVDKWGRKPCLVSGAILICVSMAALGFVFKLYTSEFSGPAILDSSKPLLYVVVVFVYLFIAAYSFSWGPVAWIYPSEIFPLEARSKSMSITTATNWMFNFAITLSSPFLLQKMDWLVYFVFSAFAAIMALSVLLFFPETKGKTLEEVFAEISK